MCPPACHAGCQSGSNPEWTAIGSVAQLELMHLATNQAIGGSNPSRPTKFLLIMEDKLFEWLKFRFIRDNHKRYHKYFDEWISNITQSQIEGFKKCMFYDTEKVLMRG